MTISDDRYIYDGVTRGDAIKFLIEHGYDKTKIRLMSDDIIGFLWDKEHRGEKDGN